MAKATKKYFEGTGTRKTSKARVRIYEGKGASVVNDKPYEEVFKDDQQQKDLLRPLVVTGAVDKFHFSAHVSGGGIVGQLDAIKLGLARALVEWDADKREALSKENLMSRDPRMKERKKYFLIKARKRPQFSKR
ncbi:30S ribosomal protein S9 [Candidatus Dojkabacteria bacterium]|nr:30S ribosomal protein S9 [Candidatus Dojkabacteria bacterium]